MFPVGLLRVYQRNTLLIGVKCWYTSFSLVEITFCTQKVYVFELVKLFDRFDTIDSKVRNGNDARIMCD